MPIYAFACTACGHRFDKLQRLSDPDPETCPMCGAAAVKRELTAPSFRLAGSGWYETDFKKDGDRKRNLAGEGGEGAKPSSDAKAEGAKTDTAKPDAAAPAKPAETKAAAAPAPATPKPAKPSE